MARIRLRLGNLNIAELITVANQVRAAMGDDARFVSLRSRVSCLAEQIDEMETEDADYRAALQLVQDRLAERQARRTKLENLLTELANSVEELSGEDGRIIQSAGFELPMLVAAPQPPSPALALGMENVSVAD